LVFFFFFWFLVLSSPLFHLPPLVWLSQPSHVFFQPKFLTFFILFTLFSPFFPYPFSHGLDILLSAVVTAFFSFFGLPPLPTYLRKESGSFPVFVFSCSPPPLSALGRVTTVQADVLTFFQREWKASPDDDVLGDPAPLDISPPPESCFYGPLFPSGAAKPSSRGFRQWVQPWRRTPVQNTGHIPFFLAWSGLLTIPGVFSSKLDWCLAAFRDPAL